VPFARGDLFFFYSDGLTEARSPEGEFFGEQRIMDIIVRNADESADELARMIFYAVSAFVGSQVFSDDMTCVLAAIRDHDRACSGTSAVLQTLGSVEELARIRDFVVDFCSRTAEPPLAGEQIDALQLAVNEAATNIIKHAYAGRSDGRIEISACDMDAQVTLTLRHQGSGFSRENVPAPNFDGTSEGGFGLYIIEQSVDEVRYTTEASGMHAIVLTKYKTPQEGEDPWNCTAKL
jgi:anti-sigma regulatory factor (Ser/Thr protein kinase)